MGKIRAAIKGVGAYLPDYILTNDELSRMVDTSDEWIMTRIGIKTRHILKGEALGTSYMGAKAVKNLLEKTKLDPNDIDNVIEQQSNVMVESEQGVLLTLHSEEPSPQFSGVPIYRIDNIVELSKSANSSSSQLRKVNSVSSTSSNHSVSSKRSTMHGRAGYESASKNRIEIVSLHCNTLFSHDLCFTHFQALEYWIQRSDFFLVSFELQTSPSREAKERI